MTSLQLPPRLAAALLIAACTFLISSVALARKSTAGHVKVASLDLQIVPGQRIGKIYLGETIGQVLAQSGPNAATRCDQIKSRGSLTGELDCHFHEWSLEADFYASAAARTKKTFGVFTSDEKVVAIVVSKNDGVAAERYMTGRGIRLGNLKQDILDAYRAPARQRDNGLTTIVDYEGLGVSFVISIVDNRITEIRVYKPGPPR